MSKLSQSGQNFDRIGCYNKSVGILPHSILYKGGNHMDITSVFKLLQDDIHSVVFATIKDMIRRKVPNEIFIIF